MIEDTKICSVCEVEKAVSEFSPETRGRGRRNQCKACRAEKERARRKTPRHKATEEARIARETQPCVYVWTDALGRPAYVGTTSNLKRRTKEHLLRSLWAKFTVAPSGPYEVFGTAEEAQEAEVALIEKFAAEGYRLLNREHNPLHTGSEFYLSVLTDLHALHQVHGR